MLKRFVFAILTTALVCAPAFAQSVQVWQCAPLGALTTAETSGALAAPATTLPIDISPTDLGSNGGGTCLLASATPNIQFTRLITTDTGGNVTYKWVTLASLGLGVASPPITSLTLAWTPSSTNTDGTVLASPIASYDIFQGLSATALAKAASVLAPATTYVTPLLAPGTYFFAVDEKEQNGSVSGQSNTASGTITAVTPPPKCPTQPANATQQAACPTGTTGTFTQTHGWTASPYPTCWVVAPWTPPTPPAGSCPPVPPPPPTKLIITCPLPTGPNCTVATQ